MRWEGDGSVPSPVSATGELPGCSCWALCSYPRSAGCKADPCCNLQCLASLPPVSFLCKMGRSLGLCAPGNACEWLELVMGPIRL